MANGKLHVDPVGSATQRAQSPKTVLALQKGREAFARVVVAGIIVSMLSVAYVVALFLKVDGAQGILPLLGTALGFLIGRSDRASDT